MRLETLAGWTSVQNVAKKLLAGFSLTAGKKTVTNSLTILHNPHTHAILAIIVSRGALH